MIAEILNVGLTCSGLFTGAMGLAFGHRFQRAGEPNPKRVYFGAIALAQGQMMVGAVVAHSPLAYLMAAATAVYAYLWWNNGGGGGLRKAVSKIKSRLTIVRLVWGSV